MKTVVVTGSFGFIGRYMALLYSKKGYSVVGIGHGNWSQEEWSKWGLTKWHGCDITLDSLMTYAGKPDIIVHCAGSASVIFSMIHPYRDYKRTAGTTSDVLEFMRLYAREARFVYPSSVAVYGDVKKAPILETSKLNPVSPYGVHKKIVEDLCSAYAHFFKLSVAIVRLFSVYGEGLRKQLLWDACTKIVRGEFDFFGTGKETRDWFHISDVTELLYLAAEHSSPECPVVNGGTGSGVTVKEVLKIISKELDLPFTPAFSGYTREGDPSFYIANIERAKKWGWGPKVDWKRGITDYVNWFKRGAV